MWWTLWDKVAQQFIHSQLYWIQSWLTGGPFCSTIVSGWITSLCQSRLDLLPEGECCECLWKIVLLLILHTKKYFKSLPRDNLGEGPFKAAGGLCICTLCTFLRPPLLLLVIFILHCVLQKAIYIYWLLDIFICFLSIQITDAFCRHLHIDQPKKI